MTEPAPLPSDRSVLTVDLGALVENWRTLKARCPGACGATVKADAYGLGMAPVARALYGAGCTTFFVAQLEEGMTLRDVLPQADIHVFSGVRKDDVAHYLTHKLIPVLNTLDEAEIWAEEAHGAGIARRAAFHIDTGMNRLGSNSSSLEDIARHKDLLERAGVDLVMSHLACADTPEHPLNALQVERFSAIRSAFPTMKTSFGNSAGILNGPDFIGDLARPGIGLYGGNPRPGHPMDLSPVVTLDAPILQRRDLQRGDPVGYGATFEADKAMTVATIGIGYGDGLLRCSSNAGGVYIDGVFAPMLGRLSMDSMVVDVSEIVAKTSALPSHAQILGQTTIDTYARWAQTISYEVLTSLGGRIARRYKQRH